MAHCTKCGSKVPDDADFCPKCGHKLKTPRGRPPSGKKADRVSKEIEDSISRGMAEKQEKYEKHEKQEKYEKGAGDSRFGPFIGGFILIWVGICLYLAFFDYVVWAIFWAYLITGIGAVLFATGILMYRYRERGDNPTGMVIGGIVMILIGSLAIVAWEGFGSTFWQEFWQGSFWVFIPIIIGILIIIGGLVALRRSPRP